MSAVIVILASMAVIAMSAKWAVRLTGNSDLGGGRQAGADGLSGGVSCVLCRRAGCRHLGVNGRCTRKSILVGRDGSCRDFDGGRTE